VVTGCTGTRTVAAVSRRSMHRTLHSKCTGRRALSVCCSPKRFQSSSRGTGCVWWCVTGRRTMSDQWSTRDGQSTVGKAPDHPMQDHLRVRCLEEMSTSSPTASFDLGLINTCPNRPFEVWRTEKTYQGCFYTILVISTYIMLSDSLGD
jgi:hypothetical protein